jgi:hypothetical protein
VTKSNSGKSVPDFNKLMEQIAASLPLEWISRRKSSPEAVKRARVRGARAESPGEDFFTRMIARMEPGDELRKFENAPGAWKRRCGRRGYVVLRDGKPMFAIVTVLN